MRKTDLNRERKEEERKNSLVADITQDFERRREERRSLECGWRLNMNFYSGNQYCDIAPSGDILPIDNKFYWQAHRVFNHIAPTVDTRCAKLEKVRPTLKVRAFSDETSDIQVAKLSANIISSASEKVGLDEIVANATLWSEICGTVFYEVNWDSQKGITLASGKENVCEGDVCLSAISPFEIYPDSLSAENMEQVGSLIRAKAVSVNEIKEKFEVEIAGREIEEFSLSPYSTSTHWKEKMGEQEYAKKRFSALLIERYIKPCKQYPYGRQEIVAEGVLLYEGDLPYCNGENGKRDFPFIRQVSLPLAGAFFGTSVVDRLIPLQRAYNAVRNRKHEFLNRLSLGVLAVEDGSVDTDELEEDGLCPGKILVYRQGSQPPKLLECGQLPAEFSKEEETLSNEFLAVSGTSEISRSAQETVKVTSATGLQLLLNQDDERLTVSAQNICRAEEEIAKQMLRLYRQFADGKRLLRMTGEDGQTELVYFTASDLSTDDIVFESGDRQTPEQKKEELLELLKLGLFGTEDGKLDENAKNKILDALGYGDMQNARDISALHIAKAQRENFQLMSGEVEVNDYDEDELHITEHLRFLLSEDFYEQDGGEEEEKRFRLHIANHREHSTKNQKKGE